MERYEPYEIGPRKGTDILKMTCRKIETIPDELAEVYRQLVIDSQRGADSPG